MHHQLSVFFPSLAVALSLVTPIARMDLRPGDQRQDEWPGGLLPAIGVHAFNNRQEKRSGLVVLRTLYLHSTYWAVL